MTSAIASRLTGIVLLTFGTGCLIDYFVARRLSDYATVPTRADPASEASVPDDSLDSEEEFKSYEIETEQHSSIILTAGPFMSPVALVPIFLVGAALLLAPTSLCKFLSKN